MKFRLNNVVAKWAHTHFFFLLLRRGFGCERGDAIRGIRVVRVIKAISVIRGISGIQGN